MRQQGFGHVGRQQQLFLHTQQLSRPNAQAAHGPPVREISKLRLRPIKEGSVSGSSKNGTSYSPVLSPNVVSGNDHTFNDLGPGTYIIRYTENDCNKYLYDTVVIKTYQFPNLDRSTAYQCDLNGFSVSAVASNGVAPFQYEIIGSTPSIPSIVTGTQSSPIFNINNGNTYSLIRLRAIDACGNATLGDASILPLANNGIMVSNNCFQNPTTLSVDSIFGATYTWYKKTA